MWYVLLCQRTICWSRTFLKRAACYLTCKTCGIRCQRTIHKWDVGKERHVVSSPARRNFRVFSRKEPRTSGHVSNTFYAFKRYFAFSEFQLCRNVVAAGILNVIVGSYCVMVMYNTYFFWSTLEDINCVIPKQI